MAVVNIAGVNLPSEKPLAYALQAIRGIGKSKGFLICKELSLDPTVRLKNIGEDVISTMRKHIESNYVIGNDVLRIQKTCIQKLIDIRSNRGIRHSNKLPVRGQNTHTNAKTRKKRSSI